MLSHTWNDTTKQGIIIFANPISKIGDYAFDSCCELTSISSIPSSVVSIGKKAFYYCSINSIILPSSVNSIGNYAFYRCSKLTSITIPNSVTTIGDYAFYDCYNLTSPVFNNNCFAYLPPTYEGTYAIPDGIKQIIGGAFYDCTSLTSIKIPSSVISIKIGKPLYEQVFDIPAFAPSLSLLSIDVEAFNTHYASENGILFNFTKDTLIQYPAGNKRVNYTIPNKVSHINSGAFYGCSNLTSITIPYSVKTIGKGAFCGCTGLTSVTIPSSVTTIDEYAFGNTNLTSVTCCAVDPPTCGGYVGFSCYTLYVPAESVDAYKKAEGWKNFIKILPIAAAGVEVTEPETEPTNNSVVILWPSVADGETYTIEIRKGEELICTLVFNANGQLMSINFAAPARGGERGSRYATAMATGWAYTVTGLENGTEYTYTIVARDNGGSTLYSKTSSFKTKEITTFVENVDSQKPQVESQKVIRDGILYIRRNGKTYDAQGRKL
ncbi:MAG: fibronectin type III domain-containing protein [Paludibacteraceae bacterium]|nr:fibronectin type III domain-containing protein [Paludibacteraceae bacterium]